MRDDISVQDGILLLGSRVIVPESLRGNILQQIHEGHLGIEKCKLRAKSCVYWPNIYREIETLINSCAVCQKYQTSQQKEPMIPSEIPSKPWHTVSADLFYTQQSWFLVVVDFYSKSPFVRKLHNLTARAVVNETKKWNSQNPTVRQRYPVHLCRVPATSKAIRLRNRAVQTMRKTILKCRETGEDIDLALLALRTTPLSSNVVSLAELLNGRIFKSTLPGKIYPSRNQEDFRNWLKERQVKRSHYFNRHAKELPELHKDQAIHIKDPVRKTWNPAKVIGQGDAPRPYIVENQDRCPVTKKQDPSKTKQTTQQSNKYIDMRYSTRQYNHNRDSITFK